MPLRSSSSLFAFAKRAAMRMFCLLVPVASWAHSSTTNAPGGSQTCFPGFVCVLNQGGKAIGGVTGLTMAGTKGSLVSNGVGIGTLSVTGSLSPATGACSVSTFGTGTCSKPPRTLGTFGVGALKINVNHWNSFTGTLFNGTFAGANGITWESKAKVDGLYRYELIGPVGGTWYNGSNVGGKTAQLFFTSKTASIGGSINLSSGTMSIVTPEPAHIGLLGTGLICLGFLVRRQAKQRNYRQS